MNYVQRATPSRALQSFMLLALVLTTIGAGTSAFAQTPTDIYNFKGGTGDVAGPIPYGLIVQGRDGNLYSAAPTGGANGNGGIFVVTPSGTETLRYSFKSSDGTTCQPGLNLGNDGNFYGDCYSGGSGGSGIVYKVTPTGTFTILHAFTGGADGGAPNGPPIQATDGNFYATTTLGGAHGDGTVYKLTSAGTLTTLYSFTGGADGDQPSATLVQGTNGDLYGSAQFGGTGGAGTVFSITTAGKLKTLHAFDGTDGSRPISAMILGTDGKLHGTTYQGGANNEGVVFEMTTAGAITVLHSFSAATDGESPEDAMVQATDGNFYGVANGNYAGAITSLYEVTSKGVFSTLYLFNGSIGSDPVGLVQSTDGLLYGDTTSGTGTGQSNGIFYSWSIGANPFLRLALTSGKAGTLVGMFGQGFDSASVVKFGGVAATSITLTGSTYIEATVPAEALTGKVTVTTGSTTLTSSQVFTVHDSWTTGAVMPTAVFGEASAAIGSKIYVVGGATTSAVVNINQIYNTSTNKWTTGTSMPTARFASASAVVDSILYVIGGCTSGCATGVGALSVVEAYDPATNTWATKAPLPTATDSTNAVVESGIIYVVGGYVPGVGRVGTVYSYNPVTDTWTTEAPLLVAKSDPAVVLLGTTIVAAGGLDNTSITGDNEGYSVSKNTWTTLVADPTPRAAGCAASIGGLLYSAAGSNGTSPLSLNESFSATAKKWTTLSSMPLAVIGPGSAEAGGLLYCFGGSNNGGLFSGTVYNNVQIYRP
jgi:uncharacterized repeat protein (TIGR03803 family)